MNLLSQFDSDLATAKAAKVAKERTEISQFSHFSQGVIQNQAPVGWNDDKIYREIIAGSPVRIWSTVLGEWIYWARDEKVKTQIEQLDPSVAAFTLVEIQELIVQCCGNAELKAVHAVKKQFLGAAVRRIG